MNNKYKKTTGFSLIEVLLSLVILFLIIGGVISFSVGTINSHIKNQSMQNAMDNARFAIEGMSKKIRTSSDIANGTDEIFFKDNVDGTKYCYQFGTNANNEEVLQVKKFPYDRSNPAPYDLINDCNGISANFEDLAGNSKLSVTGQFNVKGTDGANDKRGFVRIRVNIEPVSGSVENVAEKDNVMIQTGVSLRDYY